ncbi:Plastocyanin-like domain [Musa troglodytarum]|uniref:Plastocyanin-like domain n=1 Tax=Musa troglodytarum TaxID=320322 RepID=A0A9E7I1W0_9LILI|nr:Plastocyanin-like domain [Musa troglodytarum]
MAMAAALVVFLLAAGVGRSEGAVYKVGDAVGWTILGSPNYTAWSLSKNFKMGDTIVFEYSKNIHNVLEVSKADYDACTATSPMATYTSGNDSIAMKTKGHRYFICGIPGHCSAGQRVDIRVSKPSSAAPAYPPSRVGSSGGSSGGISTPAAAPRSSGGPRCVAKVFVIGLAVFSFAAVSGGLVRR